MNLLERTIFEIKEESAFVTQHLQGWWNGMTISQQAFALGTVSAALLLIGMLQPAPKKATMLGNGLEKDRGTFKAFMLAIVVLLVMTLGIDIAIEGVR